MSASDTGLIGWPVAHSLSPVIHGYWREQYSIEGKYVLLPVDPAAMENDIQSIKRSGLRGFNVTVPHKEAIIPFLDTIDETAHRIGAVNTVIRDGATWRGTNTDAYGFITHLRHSIPRLEPLLEKIVILGAGGAARAAIAGLKDAGATNITLLNRTRATADALAAEFGIRAANWNPDMAKETTLLVNTTSLGMQGKPTLDVNLSALPNHAAVYDIVYAPLDTALLKTARARELQTVDGLGMLLYQAQLAFKEWHGVLPAVDGTLRQLVLDALKLRDRT